MSKPSIFSKDYEKQMRRRKKRRILISCAFIAAIAFVAVSVKSGFKNWSKDMAKNIMTSDKKDVKTTESKKSEKQAPKKTGKNDKVEGTEGYDVQLSDGRTVKVVYGIENSEKLFKQVLPTEDNVAYSISPSKKNIVIFDEKSQNIILVDINGNKQDVTNPQYTSTSGAVIEKDSQLFSQPDYIWCSSPKFIDEDNIAYISQLPWLGKTTKYIWIENLKDKNHILVQGIEGEDAKLGDLTDKGLTVVLDGRTVFLNSSGNISE